MVGKCGGKVQAQSGEKRAGHSTAGAGDAEKEAERQKSGAEKYAYESI